MVVSVLVRMGSGRLPGKVMRDLCGRPMLWHLINRLRQCKLVDEIAIATPFTAENNVIAKLCESENVFCHRGSENNVLDRLVGSLEQRSAEIGVVVYGDNPLIDPVIVDEYVEYFLTNRRYDWIGNDLWTTFPPGMEVEVFSLQSVKDANLREVKPEVREHATLFIRQNPSIYKICNVEAKGRRKRSDLYMGVDTAEDLEVVASIMSSFQNCQSFSLEDIIAFLDQNPDIARINQGIHRRWRQYRKI